MSGPWDKYAGQEAPAAGPWAKYSQQPPAMENGMQVLPDFPGEGSSAAPLSGAYDTFGKRAGRFFRGLSEADAAHRSAKPSYGFGSAEALTSLLTGALAAPVLGTAESIVLGTDPEKSFSRYTYRPRSEEGQAKLGYLGALTAPLTESGADMALMPLAGESSALRATRRLPKEKPAPIPTTDELRTAKNAAYKAGNQSSVLTTPEQNSAAIAKIDEALKSENIIVDADLHPKSSALLRRLHAQKDQPLTVPEAESLRQLALEVERDIDPLTKQPTADAFRASVILDELDNSLETLSVNQGARAANARFRRSQLLDEMIHRAEIKAGALYTQAGMEHALRQEFKQLALNQRRMRGLTMEQRATIEKVAKGGAVENGLRNLGKFDPTAGGMAAFIGTGTGSLIGSAIGGLMGGGIGALAIPALGFASKRGATRMTARNVDLAREALVGRQAATVPAAPVAKTGAMSGELMQRPPLALPAPNIVAGSRSAPGTAYSREQMGLTPDVESAGALHPGAARESVPPFSNTPALPYRQASSEKSPIVVDPQGRAASTPADIETYLRELGMDRMRNVRQPRAEPTPSELLAADPAPQALLGRAMRSADQVRSDLQKLDKKFQRLPAGESLGSPRMKELAAEWERLRAELSLVESQNVYP